MFTPLLTAPAVGPWVALAGALFLFPSPLRSSVRDSLRRLRGASPAWPATIGGSLAAHSIPSPLRLTADMLALRVAALPADSRYTPHHADVLLQERSAEHVKLSREAEQHAAALDVLELML